MCVCVCVFKSKSHRVGRQGRWDLCLVHFLCCIFSPPPPPAPNFIHPGIGHRLQNLLCPGPQFVLTWARLTLKVLWQPVQKGWVVLAPFRVDRTSCARYHLYSGHWVLPCLHPNCFGRFKNVTTMFVFIFLLHRYYIFLYLCALPQACVNAEVRMQGILFSFHTETPL